MGQTIDRLFMNDETDLYFVIRLLELDYAANGFVEGPPRLDYEVMSACDIGVQGMPSVKFG